MPRATTNNSLNSASDRLYRLFGDIDQESSIKLQLNQIHDYYWKLIRRANSPSEEQVIIEEYFQFIDVLERVKKGELSRKDAIDEVESTTCIKNCDGLCYSLIQACEAIFWGTVACLSYVGCLAVGIPLTLCEPVIGIAITFSSVLIALTATEFFFEALEDIDSIEDHDSALNSQKGLINSLSMFKKPRDPDTETSSSQSEEDDLGEGLYPGLAVQ